MYFEEDPNGQVSVCEIKTDDDFHRLLSVDNVRTVRTTVDPSRATFSDSGIEVLGALPGLYKAYIKAGYMQGHGLQELAGLMHFNELRCRTLPNPPLALAHATKLHRLQALEWTCMVIDKFDLRRISSMPNLVRLSLTGCTLDDDMLQEIGKMHAIQSLTLEYTGIEDESLRHLGGLVNLQVLNVANTEISGEGLSFLESCPLKELELASTRVDDRLSGFIPRKWELKSLSLNNTEASEFGIREIERLFTHCEVDYDNDIES